MNKQDRNIKDNTADRFDDPKILKTKSPRSISAKTESGERKNGLGDDTNNGTVKPGNRTDRAIGNSDAEGS